jgi:hypothetical protein
MLARFLRGFHCEAPNLQPAYPVQLTLLAVWALGLLAMARIA